MGLILCPDCGKKISDKAEFCVNCGCPMTYIKSQKNVYNFCSVEFIDNPYGKEYFYISDDIDINPGDFALVEIAGTKEDKIVKINKTFLCTDENNAPYPIKATKHLKRKLYGTEIEAVILKYMEVYVNLFASKKFNDASAYLKKFVPLIKDYANNGYAFGQFAYGAIYDKVYNNRQTAIEWYKKAANQNYQLAIDVLKKIQPKSSDNSIYDYENTVDEFDYRDWLDYTGGEPLDSFFDHEDD